MEKTEIKLDTYQQAILNFEHKLDTVLCLPATAGSGKSTTILAKIAKIISEAENPAEQANRIIATTFSNKSARDLTKKFKSTYPELPIPQIGTLHSFGIKILKLDDIKPIIMTPWNSTLLIRSCIEELEIFDADTKKSVLTKVAEAIKDMIANLKANTEFSMKKLQNESYTDIGSYIPDETLPDLTATIEDNFHNIALLYENKKIKQNLFDYDDLIYRANQMLDFNETVLDELRASLDYVFIDEAQDCDKSQFELFFKISEHKRLTLVYDICQTLYKFRWSKPELLQPYSLQKHFTNIMELPLLYNYRSTENIVKIGNILREVADDNYRSTPSREAVKGSVKLKVCRTNITEGDVIVDMINDYMKDGFKAKDITVISRGNWYLRTIVEPALIRRNIPYIHASSKSGKKLNEKNINRLIFSMINYLVNPNNYMAVLGVIPYIRGVGPAFVEKAEMIYLSQGLTNLSLTGQFKNKSDLDRCQAIDMLINSMKDISEAINAFTISELMEQLKQLIFDYMILPSTFEDLQLIITAIINWVNFYIETGKLNLNDILENILLDINNFDVSEDKDAVILSTIHQTKGLSLPVTICGGFTSAMPQSNEYNDEQYMIYVQMSRAIEKLAIVYSAEYITKDNKSRDPYINPFLEALIARLKN